MKIQNYAISMDSSHFSMNSMTQVTKVDIKTDSMDSMSDVDKEAVAAKVVEKKLGTEVVFIKELEKEMIARSLMALNPKDNVNFGVGTTQTFVDLEALSVQMRGVIEAENRVIDFEMNVGVTRELVIENHINLVKLVDPLVINFEGKLPEVDTMSFAFDIDSDGEIDQISRLKQGNGFLALDRNGNQKIDNGTELFGAKTGDGFSELAIYDEDGNGWIDENDPIFNQLRVWVKGEEDRLVALGEVGIGAIYLDAVGSDFTFKDVMGSSLARLRESGLVVFEEGYTGVISQIDLAKQTLNSQSVILKEDMNTRQDQWNAKEAYEQPESKNIPRNNTIGEAQASLLKRIESLQAEYEELKGKLNRTSNEEAKEGIRSRMNIVQTQIIALMASSL
jgi:hypothetical protein